MNPKIFLPLAAILLVGGGCARQQAPDVAAVASTPDDSMLGVIIMKPTPTAKPPVAPQLDVRAVESSPDRKWLAIGTLRWPDKGGITIRDCADNRVVKTWKFAGAVRHLAFSPDGKNIAMTTNENQFLVRNWRTGKLLHQSKTPPNETRAPLAYSSDGRSIAVDLEGIRIVNTRTWKRSKLKRPKQNEWPALSGVIRFSPDGRWLVTSDGFEGYEGYTIYSLSGKKTRNIAEGSTWGEVVFLRDGRLFAGYIPSDDDNFIFIYDLRKSKLTRRFKRDDDGDVSFTAQDFSPDARFLVGLRANDKSGLVEIRDLQTGAMVRQFKQTARVVAWLDDQTLLAGDENGVRKLSIKSLSE